MMPNAILNNWLLGIEDIIVWNVCWLSLRVWWIKLNLTHNCGFLKWGIRWFIAALLAVIFWWWFLNGIEPSPLWFRYIDVTNMVAKHYTHKRSESIIYPCNDTACPYVWKWHRKISFDMHIVHAGHISNKCLCCVTTQARGVFIGTAERHCRPNAPASKDRFLVFPNDTIQK